VSNDWQNDIREMMKLYGQEVKSKPEIPDEKTLKLRAELCEEEFHEFLDGLGFRRDMDFCGGQWIMRKDPDYANPPDLVKLADGIVDTIVVLLGTACAFGIDIQPLWDIIMESNINKLIDGKLIKRNDGKILKPSNWQPPKVCEELVRQGWNDNEKNKTD